MWTVYTIGDGALLERALNGVAMILSLNSLNTLFKVILLVSIIQIALQAIISNRAIQFQQILFSWLIFSIVFVPKTNITIIDNKNSDVRVVANIPLGVAVISSIVSTSSNFITQTMYRAYSQASNQDYKVVRDLSNIMQMRNNLINGIGFNNINIKNNLNLQQSWINYINDCTNVGLRLKQEANNHISQQNFLNKPIIEAIKFDSNIYHTKINNTYNSNNILTCSQAYQKLYNFTINDFTDENMRSINKNDINRFNSINDSLSKISNGLLTANNYIIATTLAKILQQKNLDNYSIINHIITNQATQQRNTQWILESNIFLDTIQPNLTFFEAFIYCIIPFMACLVLTGLAGVKMITHYVLLLIWLQLWHPILAIINLYYSMTISRSLSILQTSQINLDSYIGIINFEQQLENYIATSGMLITSVGSLALLLVYGSAYTATNLSSRLQPSDHIDEKSSTPDMIRSSPIMQHESSIQYTPTTGSYVSGSLSSIGNVDVRKSVQTGLSHSKSLLETNQDGHRHVVSNAMANLVKSGTTSSQRQEIGNSLLNSNSTLQSEVQRFMRNQSQNNNISQSQIEESIGAMSMSASAGLGVDFILTLGSKGSTEYRTSNSSSNSKQQSEISSLARSMSQDKTINSLVQKSTNEMISSGISNSIENSFSKQDQKAYESSFSKLKQSQEQYQQHENLNNSLDNHRSYSIAMISSDIMNSPDAAKYISQVIGADNDLTRNSVRQTSFYQSLLPNQEQAKYASMVNALFLDDSKYIEQLELLRKLKLN